jgi:CheY-like chemotaxis protein
MSVTMPGRAPPRKQQLKQSMVFVVEDNADTRAGLKDALERDGFEVFATSDGREALARLRNAPHPDAFLLDLYMPGLSGFEIYQVLRNDPQLATIPIIVVTAAAPAHRTGLDVAATIRKPLDVEELLFTVRRAVGRGNATAR